MNAARKAYAEIKEIDELVLGDSPVHRLSPLSKLAVTFIYILTVVSFNRYDITGLFVMVLVPVIGYQASGIPVSKCFSKLWPVMPMVCAVGLFNPLFDREIMLYVGPLAVSGGVISMLTLMMKGVFCVMASFLLVATTPIDEICRALRQIRIHRMFISLLLLTYRYITVLLNEAAVMTDAYHLRAPRQKGIQFSAWGSFLGQLLLRSMDRTQELYESMVMRGFEGEFHYARTRAASAYSVPFALICSAAVVLMRFYNISAALGSLFV